MENAIVFINGLGGGPHGIPYVKRLAERLQAVPKLSYSVFEFRMNSSFRGYGTSSLREDAENIASLVKYLRELGRQKIILLGHSTGCQVRPQSVWC